MGRELLPKELVWEAGHASELALSALVDGEDAVLPRDVVSHVHSCDACMMQLGDAALMMRGVTHAVQSVKPWLPPDLSRELAKSPSSSRALAPKRVPLAAMVVAMVVAAAGAVPTLLGLPQRLAQLLLTLMHTAPVVSRSGLQVFEQGLGGAELSAMFGCAGLLLCAGVAATRLLPRPVVS
jgi:hypothetical protein